MLGERVRLAVPNLIRFREPWDNLSPSGRICGRVWPDSPRRVRAPDAERPANRSPTPHPGIGPQPADSSAV